MTLNDKKDCLVLSDIHIGHRQTSTEDILFGLKKFFRDFELTNNFDQLGTIFIAGDLFDSNLIFASAQLDKFLTFWFMFCKWCERKKIRLRLLEGTPGHDQGQGKTLTSYTEKITPSLDYKYVDCIWIEKIDVLGYVLYIPDEATVSCEETYSQVCYMMHAEGIEKVDIAIMHGAFRYQIPVGSPVHEMDNYLQIVKDWIAIGHVHIKSCYERIYAPGSWDRLQHGEEEAKGCWYMNYDNGWVPMHLENTYAKTYISLQSNSTTLESKLSSYKDGSRVRLLSSKPINELVDHLRKKYPFLHITSKITKMKEVKQGKILPTISLKQDTLIETIMNEIRKIDNITSQDVSDTRLLLESIQGEVK